MGGGVDVLFHSSSGRDLFISIVPDYIQNTISHFEMLESNNNNYHIPNFKRREVFGIVNYFDFTWNLYNDCPVTLRLRFSD